MSNDFTHIHSLLRRDPVWAAYALADLDPSFAPYCTWIVEESGLVLLFKRIAPPILLTVGSVDAVAMALKKLEKPSRVSLSVRREHLAEVRKYWDERGDHRSMLRMHLPQDVDLPVVDGVVRLGLVHAGALERLYSRGGPFTPDAFEPYQLESGVFTGVWDREGNLRAAGGTHVVSRKAGVAALGNIYTRPDCRRQGLAGRVTTAVVRGLREINIETIVLNVDRRNQAAQRLYEKLGFRVHCPFVEGTAERIS